MNIDISVIIPAYNEEEKILTTLIETIKVLDDMGVTYEIILIDDGSTDGTLFIAQSLMLDYIRTVRFDDNRGKGYAIRTGIELAVGEWIAFIDADMQIHPKNIRNLYHELNTKSSIGAIGSKYLTDSEVDYTWKRWFVSEVYRALVKILFRYPFSDTQCGCKIFRASALKRIKKKLVVNRFAYDIEILAALCANGSAWYIRSGPIVIDRSMGKGSPGIKNIYYMVKDTFRVWWRKKTGVYKVEGGV